MTRWIFLLACLGLALPVQAQAPGQDWPSRPVRFIVPFAPGGSTDLIARIATTRLSEVFGQQFVTENRAGAGATLGSDLVAKAAPDGYTLVLSNGGAHAVAPELFKKTIPYDSLRDFTHIALLASTPTVLVVNASFPPQSFKELVAYAKARPGGLNFATSGNGSSAHLVGEWLLLEAGLSLVHVPYRGAGPAMIDVIANQVPMMFDSLASSTAHIRAGKVRALGVSSERRQAGFPDVPTFAEEGLPSVISTSWFGVSGPANLPPAIVDKLAQAIGRMLQAPDIRARLAELEFEPGNTTPASFTRQVEQEVARWAATIQRTGIRLEQ